jgi:hypothetical protein
MCTNVLLFNSASAREIRASTRPPVPEILPFCRKNSDCHVCYGQTWQFCKYKKQPGPQVLNDKPKSLWRGSSCGKWHQKFINWSKGLYSRSVWMSMGRVYCCCTTNVVIRQARVNWVPCLSEQAERFIWQAELMTSLVRSAIAVVITDTSHWEDAWCLDHSFRLSNVPVLRTAL